MGLRAYTESELELLLAEREAKLRNLDINLFFTEDGFWKFCQWWDQGFFKDEKFILKDLAKIYEDMMLFDKYKKVIVSIFPRAGKSYLTTLLCAWLFAMPNSTPYGTKSQIMRNSYDDDMAKKFSRDALSILANPKYRLKFPQVRMSKKVKETLSWSLEGATEYSYTGAGLDSGITGKGVKSLRILDDPHKGYKEVLSDAMSTRSWQNYITTHLSRDDHASNCKDIIIGTRWGTSDIIGRVLATSEKGAWTEFVFPLLDENDKSICEAMCSTERALEIKHIYQKSGEYHIFEAAYQGNPVEAEDILFPPKKLQYFKKKEIYKKEVTERVLFVDFADTGDDYLSAPVGYVIDGTVYIVSWLFTQSPVEITEESVTDLCKKYRVERCVIESNSGGRSFSKTIRENLQDTLTVVDAKPATTNKETRILAKSPIIKTKFKFLVEEERDNDYNTAMKFLTKYNRKKTRQKDDAPDSLTGLADMITYDDESIMMFNY